ncbi:Cell division control 45-like protein [Hordeum vulgare]|nr:Cell division control 45-like protein [Hordeum vulgare]
MELKALAHVLSADSIRFSIYPVASTATLLLRVPAALSAPHQLGRAPRPPRHPPPPPPASTAFVVDSHRPVHLHNLAAANNRVVMLFSTDDEHTADLSYDFDVSALANALRAHAGCRFGR